MGLAPGPLSSALGSVLETDKTARGGFGSSAEMGRMRPLAKESPRVPEAPAEFANSISSRTKTNAPFVWMAHALMRRKAFFSGSTAEPEWVTACRSGEIGPGRRKVGAGLMSDL